MKKLNFLLLAGTLFVLAAILIAADHIDAPAVTGTSSDITDFYAFEGANASNTVFVVNTRALLSPADTDAANFDENVMFEINIDTDGDAVEDMVIQAIPEDDRMYFFGPTPVSSDNTGTSGSVQTDAENITIVDVTDYNEDAVTATNDGISVFAGPRDDPFFMDFGQYGAIIGGMATSFNDPGTDTFAGSNVLSIVIEVPNSMIGGTGTVNTWVETKRK
jgi:hypothetical protein